MPMIEPCLEISLADLEKSKNVLKNLEFTTIILEITEKIDFRILNSLGLNSNENKLKTDFFIYTRKTLTDLGNKEKNKNEIGSWRQKVHFIVQECSNPDVTKWASQDQRIDALRFDLFKIHELLDLSTARLMFENKKFLEINLNQFFRKKNNIIKLSRNLLKALKRADIKEVPILFSTCSSSIYDLIGKFELKGILSFLNISHEFYFDFSQIKLKSRLERNNERLTNRFIAPGIKKVEKEKK
jgi:RNase P/RNase MRP subunit p30